MLVLVLVLVPVSDPVPPGSAQTLTSFWGAHTNSPQQCRFCAQGPPASSHISPVVELEVFVFVVVPVELESVSVSPLESVVELFSLPPLPPLPPHPTVSTRVKPKLRSPRIGARVTPGRNRCARPVEPVFRSRSRPFGPFPFTGRVWGVVPQSPVATAPDAFRRASEDGACRPCLEAAPVAPLSRVRHAARETLQFERWDHNNGNWLWRIDHLSHDLQPLQLRWDDLGKLER